MDLLDENLEQLDFFESSSQGEVVSQNDFRAEEGEKDLGSKDNKGEDFSSKTKDEIAQEESVNNSSKIEGEGELLRDENILSKFKTVEELNRAYKNLQSDYTRKCQALAVLQKEKEEGKKQNSIGKNEKAFKQNFEKFLQDNIEAKEFEKEIESLVVNDERFLTSEKPFEEAWDYFRIKNFKSALGFSKDEEFLKKYIFSNKDIRDKIVKDYISKVGVVSSPVLISSGHGAKTLLTPKSRPKTVKEATKIVEDMFSV